MVALRRVVIVLFASALLPMASQAETIALNFSGTVRGSNGGDFVGFSPGQAFTGSLSFDSSAPLLSSTGSSARYTGMPAAYVSFGSSTFSIPGATVVQVSNDVPSLLGLEDEVSVGGAPISGPSVIGPMGITYFASGWALELTDRSATTLSGVDLPPASVLTDAGAFDIRALVLVLQSDNVPTAPSGTVFGDIRSLSATVPEPGTLALVALASLAALRAKRPKAFRRSSGSVPT
jgi:PEP-CTERM motif